MWLTLALRNLLRRPLRSALTVLGVATGIAMLVSVSGYGNSIAGQLEAAVTNRYQLVLMAPGSASPLSSRVAESAIERLAGAPGIEEAQPLVIGTIRTEKIPFFLILGVDSRQALSGNLSLGKGRWIEGAAAEILLGAGAARQLRLDTGDRLELNRRLFSIVGRFTGSSNMLDQAGIVGLSTAQGLLNSPGSVNLVFLKLDPTAGIRQTTRYLQDEFPDLQLNRTVDLVGNIEFFVAVERISTVMGLIAILFCVLITMNTLLMALAERRREIGILMAVGWSRRMIALPLLLESWLISLSGGMLGFLLGSGVLWFYSRSDAPRINWGAPDVSVEYAMVVLGLCALAGTMSALYPILLSIRVSPARILQRE